ncbi:MAG: hypothetical protein KAV87_63140 [Desulfobacteraceae bacterium]|nr:hypothetical protein [Desulfobacteraceae bacterium]
MHLSTIIVKARSMLTHAEAEYANGLKGNSAEILGGISVMIQNELRFDPVGKEYAEKQIDNNN